MYIEFPSEFFLGPQRRQRDGEDGRERERANIPRFAPKPPTGWSSLPASVID